MQETKRSIIFFIDRNFTSIGGDEVYFNNFVKYIDREKYDVQILMPSGSEAQFIDTQGYTCTTYTYSYRRIRNFFRFLNPVMKFLSFYTSTRKKLKAMRKGIVITSDYLCLLSAYLSNKKMRTVYVPGSLVTQDFFFDVHMDGGRLYKISRTLERMMITLLELVANNSADRIVVSTLFSKDNIRRMFKVRASKIHIIPMGIDLEKFNAADRKHDNNKKIILSVCRLAKSKNVHMAIEVLPLLPEDYVWFVLGDGIEKDALLTQIRSRKVEKRFFLLGQRKDVQRYYSLCDAFVHLSYHENYGLVLLEAMSCGKPPVVLDPQQEGVFTASREIVTDGYNGYFVRNNAHDIADKICKVVVTRDSRISENCISSVKGKYSFARHMKEISSLIHKIK